MRIDVPTAAARLLEQDRILILCHRDPDGDTLGSGFALYHVLRSLGKTAWVLCDSFPRQFAFLYPDVMEDPVDIQYIVAVDVADEILLGESMNQYKGKVDLCIDHHPSNRLFAKETLLEEHAAAAALTLVKVFDAMNVPITREVADGLYTGIATDTGCFKYSNTSPEVHRAAARLMETGIDTYAINRLMFDVKSRGRLAVEQLLLESVRYYYDGLCAVMVITDEIVKAAGARQSELGTLTSLPRQIEGVEIGVTLRQRGNGYKVSVHTGGQLNAAELCAKLGGGGHFRAAGCFLHMPLEEAIDTLMRLVGEALPHRKEIKIHAGALSGKAEESDGLMDH